ncbi:Diaminopimelate epimerase-like protein [Clathrospora elynae]|uniref:Diaminopimelate epimerase-like protein n=1 Tax=Clathrospora elynae TaxID=706981 RepID=A0A6A5SZ19_9PLEO|nr:Diaminopimelate epimerase-like protein [Clathrospora elynae]
MSSPSQLDFVTVDVFTSKPYKGNPLAIVRIPHGRAVTQEQKQTITREFNLSETTFLHEKNEAAQEDFWTVDIFMVARELPFAGHPTIGTACYVLGRTAQERGIQEGVIEASFKLKSGLVGLRYDVARGTAKASIPHDVHIHKRRWTRDELFALQPRLAEAHQQGKIEAQEDYPIVSIVKGMTFILVELESLEALGMVSLVGRSLAVDGLDEDWKDTFIAAYFFVRGGKGEKGSSKLRTRMIEGPLEDPATGSAASDLAAYLSLTEAGPNETVKYEIVQGVEMGRRSEILIDVVMAADRSIATVYLEGGAVEVMEGRLRI